MFNPNTLKQYNTLCNDGTYSKSSNRSACSWHGGVKQYGVSPSIESPLEAHPAAVYLVPLRDVYFDRALFQNREQEYSEESVQRIVEAVKAGSFRFEVFDPVLLWRRPSDGRLIVLSGHSRTEAFHRLNNSGYKEFSRIPAKIIEVSREEARRIALESNTLATRETDSERANYYRQLREKEAIPADELTQIAKKNEGRNASKIIAYSYLNPNGKTFFALKAIEGKDPTSQENIKNVANWIGSARQRFPMLSNLHEDELFDFLIGGAYGRRFTRMNDFLQKVQAVIYQRTEFGNFDDGRPLNIANMAQPTHGEQQYNAIRQELLKSVQTLEKTYKDKIKELNDRPEATQQDKDRILRPLEMQLRTARQKLLDFEQKATKPGTAAKQELNLFALSGTPNIFRDIDHLITGLFGRPSAVGRIVDDAPPGRSLCRDGQFSTYGRGPGRCSYHGGVMFPTAKAKKKPEPQSPAASPRPAAPIGEAIYTQYTTRKGKTAPAIAVKFYKMPDPDVRQQLKDNYFWWVPGEMLWYGWDNEKNRRVVESLLLSPVTRPVAGGDPPAPTTRPAAIPTAANDQTPGFKEGDTVLVKHDTVFIPIEIKKIGNKYIYPKDAYLGRFSFDQVYPLSHQYRQRLEALQKALIARMEKDYHRYYYSVVNPDLYGKLAYSFSGTLWALLGPYEKISNKRKAWELLESDLNQAGYKNLKEWFAAAFPKPTDKEKGLPVLPKRGDTYSRDDWNSLVSYLYTAIYPGSDRGYFPQVTQLRKRAEAMEERAKRAMGEDLFYWVFADLNPNKKSASQALNDNSPTGYLRRRFQLWVNDQFKGIKNPVDKTSIKEFADRKNIALANAERDLSLYERNWKPQNWKLNANPLLIAELDLEVQDLKKNLLRKIYNFDVPPRSHSNFKLFEYPDDFWVTEKNYKEHFIAHVKYYVWDKTAAKWLQNGFFDTVLDPKTHMSSGFNRQMCIDANINPEKCWYQDPYGYTQLNGLRWGYIFLIENALKNNYPLNEKPYEDYKELVPTGLYYRMPEKWQYNKDDKSENINTAQGVNLVLEALGVKDIRAHQRPKFTFYEIYPSGSGGVISKEYAQQKLAGKVANIDNLILAGRSIIRNWGKSFTVPRPSYGGTQTFRVGDVVKIYHIHEQPGTGSHWTEAVITNTTVRGSGDVNVMYFDFDSMKMRQSRGMSETKPGFIYPISHVGRIFSLSGMQPRRTGFNVLCI